MTNLFSVHVFSILSVLSASYADEPANSRCDDVSMECEYRQKYCDHPEYTESMFQECRKTCNWCQKSLEDVMRPNRQILAAPAQVPVSVTPGDTDGSGSSTSTESPVKCVDLSNSCTKTAPLCTTTYQQIMSVKCPKTCGKC